jgi:catechol 2,3-dioxygenase-like lactoylglutathione lyase family enzyme
MPSAPIPMTVGLNHVAALTPDLDRYIRFYVDAFGARLVSRSNGRGDHPPMAVLAVGDGAVLNAFEVPADQIVGDRARIGGRGPIDHYALAVANQAALQAVRDRLVQLDASSGEITDQGPALSVFFRDPDGAELEVCFAKADHGAAEVGLLAQGSD